MSMAAGCYPVRPSGADRADRFVTGCDVNAQPSNGDQLSILAGELVSLHRCAIVRRTSAASMGG
jgi:hypothetical protein